MTTRIPPNIAAIDFGAGVSDAWRAIATFVPKLVGFLLIMLIGWFIAKALAKVVDKVLERVGFDRVVERGGVKQALARSKYDASDIIAKLVYYAILLLTLQIAFGVWGANPVSSLLADIVGWLPKAVVAIVIVVIAAAIASAAKDFIAGATGGLSYGRVLANIASVFILALGIIAALNQIGVATTVTTPVLIAVLATVAGIAIVGVGGGLVRPMQERWEGWLNKAEQEIPRMREQAESHQPESGVGSTERMARAGATAPSGTSTRPPGAAPTATPGNLGQPRGQ
ncbi:mechanosensitive ion channel family protein [Actinokineospora iranica]|uniref:Conserved TM helix n=1 Tax=Actinokineospora iranica TaxID=1271860 RepID=A0A1G6RZK9_9PSEU|nr:hypothetical protein [Actinokineospora iranica]SDD09841.1 Conserved TM helix [Actinokineospora iranica]